MNTENRNKAKRSFHFPSVAFLICLIIAGMGWCIINFAKEYQVTLDYKVVCSQLPEGKKSVTVSDTLFSLTFYTRGLNYLNRKYSDENRQLTIPIDKLIAQKPKRSAYTFSHKEMKEFLVGNGYFGSELVDVAKPEIVTFYIK